MDPAQSLIVEDNDSQHDVTVPHFAVRLRVAYLFYGVVLFLMSGCRTSSLLEYIHYTHSF